MSRFRHFGIEWQGWINIDYHTNTMFSYVKFIKTNEPSKFGILAIYRGITETKRFKVYIYNPNFTYVTTCNSATQHEHFSRSFFLK